MYVSIPLRSLFAHPKVICTSHGGVRAFWVTCPVLSAAGGEAAGLAGSDIWSLMLTHLSFTASTLSDWGEGEGVGVGVGGTKKLQKTASETAD